MGLSRNNQPASLLKQVNGKPLKPPPEVDDPPQSTDDEDEGQPQTGSLRQESSDDSIPEPSKKIRRPPSFSSDDSDGERRRTRVNIKKTNFIPSSQAGESRKRGRAVRGQPDMDGNGAQDKASASISSAKRLKLPGKPLSATKSSPAPSTGTHLKDRQGFTKVSKVKATYTKKVTSSQESAGNISGGKYVGTARPRTFKAPNTLDSPKKAETSKLRVPGEIITSPPPKQRGLKPVKRKSSPEVDDSPSSPTGKPIPKIGKGAKGTSGRRKGKTEPPKSPPAPKAVFRMPLQFSQIDQEPVGRGDPVFSIFDLPSDLESDAHSADAETSAKETETILSPTLCPWCEEPIDKAFLDDFAKGKRMNVRMQERFCQKHKRKTALETWQSRGYPEVEWSCLEDRFSRHRELMLGIVSGEHSHYRSILAENIESGKARSLKQEDNLNPGYYGPRGFNLMCDYFVGEFSDLLKQRALDDRVISGRGSAAFIQSVLVAELAVQLIKEDMDVSAEEARVIMEESKVLAEMVHEDS